MTSKDHGLDAADLQLDATGSPAAVTAPTVTVLQAPAALTSLSSLLGGDIEVGATCAADGTCD